MEKEKCKHEWRQKFKSTFNNEPDYLYDDGYYCIHCLKIIKE